MNNQLEFERRIEAKRIVEEIGDSIGLSLYLKSAVHELYQEFGRDGVFRLAFSIADAEKVIRENDERFMDENIAAAHEQLDKDIGIYCYKPILKKISDLKQTDAQHIRPQKNSPDGRIATLEWDKKCAADKGWQDIQNLFKTEIKPMPLLCEEC